MKNKTLFVFAVLMSLVFSFSACTKKSEAPAAPTPVPPTATPQTVTVYSEAALDGLVSNTGTVNTAGTAASAGDTDTGELMQGFVAFTLPTLSSPVTSAMLRLYFENEIGVPLSLIGPVHIAHITPNYTSLGAPQFLHYTGNTSLGIMVNTYMDGTFALDVTAQVEADRLAGNTYSQFRVYLAGFADGNATFDYMQFYTSDSMTNKPELVIEHY